VSVHIILKKLALWMADRIVDFLGGTRYKAITGFAAPRGEKDASRMGWPMTARRPDDGRNPPATRTLRNLTP